MVFLITKTIYLFICTLMQTRCFIYLLHKVFLPLQKWSVRVAERLPLPTSDHGVAGSNPAGSEILPEPKRRFIAQSLSCSPFHRLKMTEILLKGRKTLTHPSILCEKNVIHDLATSISSKWLNDKKSYARTIVIIMFWQDTLLIRISVWHFLPSYTGNRPSTQKI